MTKPKTYIAKSDAEAKALADGTQTVIVIPCKPSDLRPHKGIVPSRDFADIGSIDRLSDGTFVAYLAEFKGVSIGRMVAPYEPGDEILVKQRWNSSPATRPKRRIYARPTVQSVDCRPQDGKWCWFVEVTR